MKLIFLDFDGCLNDKKQYPNGYYGVNYGNVVFLNQLLDQFDDAYLVISSAWRYMCIAGSMTLNGFENMMLTHGVNCRGRIHGITEPDEKFLPVNPTDEDYQDLTIRSRQIEEYVTKHNPDAYVVFDDLPVPVKNLVHICSGVGISQTDIDLAVQILSL